MATETTVRCRSVTIVRSKPGDTLTSIGPLRLDMFRVALAVVATLILSVLAEGEYDPEGYGLEPQTHNE